MWYCTQKIVSLHSSLDGSLHEIVLCLLGFRPQIKLPISTAITPVIRWAIGGSKNSLTGRRALWNVDQSSSRKRTSSTAQVPEFPAKKAREMDAVAGAAESNYDAEALAPPKTKSDSRKHLAPTIIDSDDEPAPDPALKLGRHIDFSKLPGIGKSVSKGASTAHGKATVRKAVPATAKPPVKIVAESASEDETVASDNTEEDSDDSDNTSGDDDDVVDVNDFITEVPQVVSTRFKTTAKAPDTAEVPQHSTKVDPGLWARDAADISSERRLDFCHASSSSVTMLGVYQLGTVLSESVGYITRSTYRLGRAPSRIKSRPPPRGCYRLCALAVDNSVERANHETQSGLKLAEGGEYLNSVILPLQFAHRKVLTGRRVPAKVACQLLEFGHIQKTSKYGNIVIQHAERNLRKSVTD
ncbi:hypothetical protein DFH08DRAFT_820708 [Mycena albidolilacea]|uniref:Uncharacterized protein n=1 Tax=Mycena albidolilacea TaxID=1033008 RepID=A0AAD6ZB81_9AGAR|nr:hypothetical protein DFH08DRAFT_820708 [Mycena albidolilacea]